MLAVIVAAHNSPRPIEFKIVYGLWITPEFNRWTMPGEPPWAIRDAQAEAIFAQLNPKTCIDRCVASDGRGREVQRVEVWEATTLSLYYSANHPARETTLQIRSITDLSAMRDHWMEMVAGLRKNAPADIRFEEFRQNI